MNKPIFTIDEANKKISIFGRSIKKSEVAELNCTISVDGVDLFLRDYYTDMKSLPGFTEAVTSARRFGSPGDKISPLRRISTWNGPLIQAEAAIKTTAYELIMDINNHYKLAKFNQVKKQIAEDRALGDKEQYVYNEGYQSIETPQYPAQRFFYDDQGRLLRKIYQSATLDYAYYPITGERQSITISTYNFDDKKRQFVPSVGSYTEFNKEGKVIGKYSHSVEHPEFDTKDTNRYYTRMNGQKGYVEIKESSIKTIKYKKVITKFHWYQNQYYESSMDQVEIKQDLFVPDRFIVAVSRTLSHYGKAHKLKEITQYIKIWEGLTETEAINIVMQYPKVYHKKFRFVRDTFKYIYQLVGIADPINTKDYKIDRYREIEPANEKGVRTVTILTPASGDFDIYFTEEESSYSMVLRLNKRRIDIDSLIKSLDFLVSGSTCIEKHSSLNIYFTREEEYINMTYEDGLVKYMNIPWEHGDCQYNLIYQGGKKLETISYQQYYLCKYLDADIEVQDKTVLKLPVIEESDSIAHSVSEYVWNIMQEKHEYTEEDMSAWKEFFDKLQIEMIPNVNPKMEAH